MPTVVSQQHMYQTRSLKELLSESVENLPLLCGHSRFFAFGWALYFCGLKTLCTLHLHAGSSPLNMVTSAYS